MADRIDDAIAAAIPEGEQVEMLAIPVQLSSSGRPARVDVPRDASDAELTDLIGFLATQVRAAVRDNRERPSGLVVPRRVARAMPD